MARKSREADVLKLYDEGKSIREIKSALSIGDTAIYGYLGKNDRKLRQVHTPIPKDLLPALSKDYEDGVSIRDLSQKYKVSEPRIVHKMGRLKVYRNSRLRQQKVRRRTYHYEIWKKYRLDPDVYDRMVIEQEGRCLICGEPSDLVVDHDHKTGEVRGLLCSLCNSGLGMFRDRIGSLVSAAHYLER